MSHKCSNHHLHVLESSTIFYLLRYLNFIISTPSISTLTLQSCKVSLCKHVSTTLQTRHECKLQQVLSTLLKYKPSAHTQNETNLSWSFAASNIWKGIVYMAAVAVSVLQWHHRVTVLLACLAMWLPRNNATPLRRGVDKALQLCCESISVTGKLHAYWGHFSL